MSYAVGIDLGTTNSVIAVYRRGVAETLPVDGKQTMPSVISLRENGDLLVGQAAKSRMMIAPEATIGSAKRFMGNRRKSWRIGSKQLSPVNVSAIVLKKLVESARQALGQDIWDAVITIPAYFNEQQREDTRRAGEEAGLNVLRLIPEPTAAAIAYGLDKGRDQTIMVYDLGGGTFDVSILQVKGNLFEVKAVGGDSQLGGDDFDIAVMKWAADKFKKQTRIDIFSTKTPEGLKALRKLKEAAEAAKIELSQSDTTQISIPDVLGQPLDYELTVEEYNGLIKPMLDKTVTAMKTTLKDAELRADDIDRVILVGGSTKNRAVKEIVAREIKDPYVSDRVDEVVAHGGAIMAANLFLPEASPDNVPIEVSDVTAHSLGIDALTDESGKTALVFQPIIPRQTTYPCRMGFLGSTNHPLQDSVEMTVYRGEERDPERNEKLGELTLPVVPPSKDVVPIGAIFELDADGIIHFTAVQMSLASRMKPIIDNAMRNDGALDEATIGRIDDLVKGGDAKSKTVQVRTTQSSAPLPPDIF